jgi:hypothetical protein
VQALYELLSPRFEAIKVVAYVRQPASYHLAMIQQNVRRSSSIPAPAKYRIPIHCWLGNSHAMIVADTSGRRSAVSTCGSYAAAAGSGNRARSERRASPVVEIAQVGLAEQSPVRERYLAVDDGQLSR